MLTRGYIRPGAAVADLGGGSISFLALLSLPSLMSLFFCIVSLKKHCIMVFSSVFRTFALCLLIAQVWAGGIQDLVNALMKPVEDSVSHLPPLDWVPHPK